MTEIYLVRHPESLLNADRSVIGGQSNETPLTSRGIEQAKRFSKAFAAAYPKPDALYSSSAVRTQTLLDIYNETNGEQSSYTVEPDLLEMSQGNSEGLLRADVYTPEVLEVIAQQQHNFSLPGGESLNTVADRMLGWAYRTAQKHPDSVILAATHGQAIRASIGRLLNWSHYETTIDPNHYTDNVSLTHITIESGEATVNFFGKDIIEPVPSELY